MTDSMGEFYFGMRDLGYSQEHFVLYENPVRGCDEILAACGIAHPALAQVKWMDCPVASRWVILRTR